MTRAAATAGCWLAVIVGGAHPVQAQSNPGFADRIEVEVGGGFHGASALGVADAELRTGVPDRSFRLFSTDSRLGAAPSWHVRVGYAVTPRIGLEGGLSVSRPDLRTAVSADAEQALPVTVAERIDQYNVEAGVRVALRRRVGARTEPHLLAGAGYLRQLHEGRRAIDEGYGVYAGGGARHRLTTPSWGPVRTIGVRAEARVHVVSGGVGVLDRARWHASVSGGLLIGLR